MNRFDAEALTWDENPDHFKRSKAIADEIKKRVPIFSDWSGMELGCGTGILGFFFQPLLKELIMVDESKEMLHVTQEKINSGGFNNMRINNINLLMESYLLKHNFIMSQMTFHHILDIPKILSILYKILLPGGYLCIADLVEEDGTFHSHIPDFDGHKGFKVDWLKQELKTAGFVELEHTIGYTLEKKNPIGQKEFPIFLVIAKKPNKSY